MPSITSEQRGLAPTGHSWRNSIPLVWQSRYSELGWGYY